MLEFIAPSIWKKHTYDDDCDLSGVKYRIGSDSMRGMVFKIVIDKVPMACKILFATEDTPLAQNEREIDLTIYLGDKYPLFFPKVFRAERCDNIIVPPKISNNALVEKARIYHIQRMLPLPKRERKQLELEYRKTYDARIYDPFWDGKIPALLMFSELGKMDLATWSKQKHADFEWKHVIDKVFEALNLLRAEKITHNDLHHGNILIMSDGNVKIIDLGEALDYYEPNRDLEKFLDQTITSLNRPQVSCSI